MDRRAAQAAIADFLRALGRDPGNTPELAETPARVVEAFADELLAGYSVDVPALIAAGSTATRGEGVVALQDIAVATVCPHHLMPGLGRANVVYRPGERVLGLGAIARLVEACARRLVLQETIGTDVVGALLTHAGARGAYCEITLVHGCLSARGACQTSARATTVYRAGELSEGDVLLALGRAGGAG
ncbi:MAG TPA: GTP cyclohydrolase I [Polyangiaceae bacterium]